MLSLWSIWMHLHEQHHRPRHAVSTVLFSSEAATTNPAVVEQTLPVNTSL